MKSELYDYLEMKQQAFGVGVCWVNSRSNKVPHVARDRRGKPAGESREVTTRSFQALAAYGKNSQPEGLA